MPRAPQSLGSPSLAGWTLGHTPMGGGQAPGGSGASMVMDMGRSVACLDSVHSIVEGNVQ